MRMKLDVDGFGAEVTAEPPKSRAALWVTLGFFAVMIVGASQLEHGSWFEKKTRPKRRNG